MLGEIKRLVKEQLALTRWRLRRPKYPAIQPLQLHLGCGPIDLPGFVNVDARPAPHVHHVQGIDRLTEFADNSASLIYASHCLEHISHREVVAVLREWRRVLCPGGIVRLSVPDFDLMLAIYEATGRDMRNIQMPLMGAQSYRQNYHYTCFNATELARQLQAAGFIEPTHWQAGDGPLKTFDDWSGRPIRLGEVDYAVSLNMEARKP